MRVEFSSINYKDALATIPKGQIARISPLVPGVDLAGEVVESSDDALPVRTTAARHRPRPRRRAPRRLGEYARVPARLGDPAARRARGAPGDALGTAGFTAGLSIQALEDHGLSPDDGPVLVLGASGGVGSVAVGALATAGYEVWAATGKAGEHDYLRSLGAHEIVSREETTADAERPLERQRWAACVDPVGGAATAYALRTTRYGGAVAVSGLTAGATLKTTVLPFILRWVSLLGIDSVAAPSERRRAVWARLAGDLRPRGLDESIAREVDLDGIEPVLDALLEGGAVGRTVVRVWD